MTNLDRIAYAVLLTSVLPAIAPAWAACDAPQDQSPRYTIANGEVHDKETGLIWQRCSLGQHWTDGSGCAGPVIQLTWSDAMRRAEDGWRLPTRDELSTLVLPMCEPAINESLFPNMQFDKPNYWSSTSDGAYHWFVDFRRGASHFTFNFPVTNISVRLVRSER